MRQFSESAVASEASDALIDEIRSVTDVAELDARATVQHQRQIRNALSAKTLYARLYSSSHASKILQLAKSYLTEDPSLESFPEHLPILATRYETKPCTFWTCAFLPGCLFALLERSIRFPKAKSLAKTTPSDFHGQLLDLCRSWSEPLHRNALRTDTHDLGFMVHPLRMDWELTGNPKSLESVIKAAHNLSSRFSDQTGAIRSWNLAGSKAYEIYDMDENFLVIVDSMANLDLLFYVGNYMNDQQLIARATSHANAVIKTLLRPDFTTYHVVNMNPRNGEIQQRFTHQGYNDDSCWSRGQAWALLGYAQAFIWTNDPSFLVVAMSIANYFVMQLSSSTLDHPYVPPWDFGAPLDENQDVLRDTSAGMIAANGLLLLHQTLQGQSSFLDAVHRIVQDTLSYSLADSTAEMSLSNDEDVSLARSHQSVLVHSTANNNENALVRYADHGYVVADFYFLELGNKLLRMGYCS